MKLKLKFVSLLFLFFTPLLISQNNTEKLINSYENYSQAPRELAYVHLNKSTYILGEMLGFNAYILDKFTKERSEMTSNLYCTISDEKGKIIKEKLILVKNGVGQNVFNIDSTFTQSRYTFKAYTNYMLNFKEQNHYEQSFDVIDADIESEIKWGNNLEADIDLQALPEGGHLLYDVINTIGVIAKDNLGFGLPEAMVKLISNGKDVLSEFKLNQFGIGKTSFKPEVNNVYTIEIIINDKTYSTPIHAIKPIGVVFSINDLQNRIALSFKTNKNSLSTIGSQTFQLAIHNGNEMRLIPVNFNLSFETNIAIDYSNLFRGMNIFTLFDHNNNPILERMFFNYDGISKNTINDVKYTIVNDSLSLNFKIPNYNSDKFSRLSISVLPAETKSYSPQHTIFSSIYLQPYVKVAIENGGYYFTDINRKTKYDLDLLLLTQGWSSYSWNTIFNGEVILNYAFERGINAIANVNDNSKGGTYLVYPLKNNITQIFELKSNETKFLQENLVPTDGESFRAGFVKSNNTFKTPGLYVQFYPSSIPYYPLSYNQLSSHTNNSTIKMYGFMNQSWERIESLDEVYLEGKKRYTKTEKLKAKSINAKFDILDDRTRLGGMRLTTYLNQIGWRANEIQGQISITNPRANWGPTTPLVYLDDVLLNGLSALIGMSLEVIDYIESDFYGLRGGINGSAGTIRIYTDPSIINRLRPQSSNIVEFKFPLTFSADKNFYTPTYQFYNTSFFKEYGVIGWFANKQPDNNGAFQLNMFNSQTKNINLYIEGITNDNELVSELKTLTIE